MSELNVISASAGTGKTHRLAQELLAALTGENPTAPEGVVAVTFTRTAAAELEARVRTALIDAGHADLARRLAGARIGTVHSVCARLVQDHAFVLGLSPELEVIDEAVAASLFEEALAAAIVDDERAKLDDLEQRLSLGEDATAFYELVRAVVDRARGNELSDDELRRSCALSFASLQAALCEGEVRDGAALDAALERAVAAALTALPVGGNARQQEIRDTLQRTSDQLSSGEALPWAAWLELEALTFLKDVAAAARAHVHHPRLLDDLRALIELVFGVARRAIARYDDDKRQAGVVDFVDLERLALEAVARDDVRAALQGDVQLLLVDEFQDTNPVQLGVFQALEHVAARTIVVGDEKQSIFGFRDARPELLGRLAARATSTARLDVSYRSRPGLVRAVSAVFAAAFQGHHGTDDVTLRPVLVNEPPGLGPHAERWTALVPDDGSRVLDEDVLADGVAELLSGARAVVVRPTGGEGDGIRPIQAKDVAVLCRYRSDCRKAARALAQRGIPVVLAQRGLSHTNETRLMSAALALWLDARDGLARVTLVTLLEPDRHDIIAAVADAPIVDHDRGHRDPLGDHPLVVALTAAAAAQPAAGLIAAFDGCVSTLRLHDVLAAMPSGPQRLADLAALRALAVRFVRESHARGRAPTISAFLDRLVALRTERRDDDDSHDDDRGVVAGEDAVSVLTYHKAKGKEWPLVVLMGLWRSPPERPFDVVVEEEELDATPLAKGELPRRVERWLRLWPSPFGERGPHSSSSSFRPTAFQRLEASPPQKRAAVRALDELRRLLYVAFTRPRDRLVIVGDHTIWSRGAMRALTVGPDARPLCGDATTDDGVALWAGAPIQVAVHRPARLVAARAPFVPTAIAPLPSTPAPSHPPMFLQPSAQEATGAVGARVTIGDEVRVGARTRDELNPLGSCVHAFLAWDAFVASGDPRRRQRAAQLLRAYGVAEHASAAQLVTIGDRLWRALDARYPGHTRLTEVPLVHRVELGSIVRGQIDLLVVRSDGTRVIIDHKTTLDDDVAGYAGQLGAYAAAVRAAGYVVAEALIHLPLLGELVEVLPVAPALAVGGDEPSDDDLG